MPGITIREAGTYRKGETMTISKTCPPRPGRRGRKPEGSKYSAAVLEYIISYKRNNDGASPTLREICTACNVPSTSIAYYVLMILERDGKICRDKDKYRGIRVTGGSWSMREEA